MLERDSVTSGIVTNSLIAKQKASDFLKKSLAFLILRLNEDGDEINALNLHLIMGAWSSLILWSL